MADHSELVAEMLILEQMGTQERQKLAKKRRLQQIKKWSQREKEWMAKEKQMNKRLASKISEENNGLNLKHYTQYSISEKSPTIRSPIYQQSATDNCKSNNNNNNNSINTNSLANNNNNISGSNVKYKQNNVNSINNNILRKYPNGNVNSNSRSVSLNGLDAEDLCSRPINSKVHFDSGVMLLEAAARNDLNEVKRLLMLGVSPDSTNHDGLTTLHQGCIEASEPMINLLLEFGANVDARDTEQWTPLHAACTCGHLNLVRILVERGADLLAINGDGNMPFDLCEDDQTLDYLESQMVAKGITQEMIDLARVSTEMQMCSEIQKHINNGVDIRTITYANGVTPAHVAAANGYLSALKFLIKHGADMTALDNDLWTPLHGVACWGNESHLKIIELLVESGVSLDAKTINEETVFDLCDNEQILDKLNEMKDEIESKQAASDADRLRRTQSRTNSRIHSIRRTSVRDKSQISRRDAREEALLRSESSGSLPKSTDGNTRNIDEMHPLEALNNGRDTQVEVENKFQQQQQTTPSASNNVDSSKHSEPSSNDIFKLKDNVILHDENDKMPEHRSQQNSYNKLSNDQSIKDSPSSTSNLKTTYNRNDSGIETTYLCTDLDAQANASHNKTIFNNHQQLDVNSSHSGSQRNPASSANQIKKHNIVANDVGNKRPDLSSPVLVNGYQRKHDDLSQDLISNSAITTYDQPDSVDVNHRLSHNSNGIANSGSTMDDRSPRGPLNIEIVDASKQPMTITSGSKVIVQFNSANYTLSNLKKQRSDMRMRTISIGGLTDVDNVVDDTVLRYQSKSNGVVNNDTLIAEHRGMPQAQDDPAMTSQKWSTANGLVAKTKRTNNKRLDDERQIQSPNTSLRRFRGEPSELIGGDERNVKHGCCSII